MPHFISQAEQMTYFLEILPSLFSFRLSISFDQRKWSFWNTRFPWKVPKQYSVYLEHTCWTWSLYFTFLSRFWNREPPRQMYGYCWGKGWKYIYWWAPWWVLSTHHYLGPKNVSGNLRNNDGNGNVKISKDVIGYTWKNNGDARATRTYLHLFDIVCQIFHVWVYDDKTSL